MRNDLEADKERRLLIVLYRFQDEDNLYWQPTYRESCLSEQGIHIKVCNIEITQSHFIPKTTEMIIRVTLLRPRLQESRSTNRIKPSTNELAISCDSF